MLFAKLESDSEAAFRSKRHDLQPDLKMADGWRIAIACPFHINFFKKLSRTFGEFRVNKGDRASPIC
jgi:hypothetical protein